MSVLELEKVLIFSAIVKSFSIIWHVIDNFDGPQFDGVCFFKRETFLTIPIGPVRHSGDILFFKLLIVAGE